MARDIALPGESPASGKAIALWLFGCCAMVFAMVVLGGVTRLTNSGLSMVEWQPFTLLPPLSEAEWQDYFARYQLSPQYHKVNAGMTLAGFKAIFWLEYLHRLWGRAIGAVFLLPFLYFLATGAVDRKLAVKLSGLFVLGGLQGGLGWFMVKSGLIDRPDVSQYRLAAHLAAAFLIYGCMLWVALDLWRGPARPAIQGHPLRRRLLWLLALLCLTILSGAFVAGLDAGLTYNSFPLMDGKLIPDGLGAIEPWWRNPFENIATVQFDHRILAVATVILCLSAWLSSRRLDLPEQPRHAVAAVAAMAGLQAGLGVSTLLLVVPLPLAAAHQAGALTLFTLLIFAIHSLRYHETGHTKA